MSEKPTSLEEKWAAAEADANTETEQAAEPEVLGADQPPNMDPRIAELEQQLSQLSDQALRQQAEMANYRRRTERDRAEQIDDARGRLLRDLLPVIDDFERALGAETDNLDAYRTGVELILKSLHDYLGAAGVERVDPAGEEFDPHLHQAVDQHETDDVPANHVASVYQPGYTHGERLLRPAMVAVARTPVEPDGTADETN